MSYLVGALFKIHFKTLQSYSDEEKMEKNDEAIVKCEKKDMCLEEKEKEVMMKE